MNEELKSVLEKMLVSALLASGTVALNFLKQKSEQLDSPIKTE